MSRTMTAACVMWPLSRTDDRDGENMHLSLGDNSDIFLAFSLELEDDVKLQPV